MSALGQKPPCGASAAMSASEGRPDMRGPKADVATSMSAPEGIADMIVATVHDRS